MIEEKISLSGSLSSKSKESDTDFNNRINKSVELVDQSKEDKQDSDEVKHNIGKKKEELKFKQLIKDKLKVTNVPKMYLYNPETEEENVFSDLYDFKGFLGTGSFGFVV
jgi:hypothetical protein